MRALPVSVFVLLCAFVVAGGWGLVRGVGGWACSYYEDREGAPVHPDGRVDADAFRPAAFSSKAVALPRADGSFDPAASSWKVVRRVPNPTPAGTVLEVSACQPYSLLPKDRVDYYLTVSSGPGPRRT